MNSKWNRGIWSKPLDYPAVFHNSIEPMLLAENTLLSLATNVPIAGRFERTKIEKNAKFYQKSKIDENVKIKE